MSCKAKIRRHPDGWQGFLTQSGRKIHRQDVRGEILNRLLDEPYQRANQRRRCGGHSQPEPPWEPAPAGRTGRLPGGISAGNPARLAQHLLGSDAILGKCVVFYNKYSLFKQLRIWGVNNNNTAGGSFHQGAPLLSVHWMCISSVSRPGAVYTVRVKISQTPSLPLAIRIRTRYDRIAVLLRFVCSPEVPYVQNLSR